MRSMGKTSSNVCAAARALFVCVAVGAAATACTNLFDPGEDAAGSDSGSHGSVRLRIADSAGGSVAAAAIGQTVETIEPDAGDIEIAEYVLTGEDPNGEVAVEESEEAGGDPLEFEVGPLVTGDWTFTVEGYTQENGDAPVVDDVAENVTIESGETQQIELEPDLSEGDGELSVTVELPGDSETTVESVSGELTDVNDEGNEPAIDFEDPANNEAGLDGAPVEVPAGYYDLVVTVYEDDEENDEITSRVTNVHIYPEIESDGTVGFSKAAIDDPPVAPDDVTAELNTEEEQIDVSWDGSGPALGYRVVREIDDDGFEEDDFRFVDNESLDEEITDEDLQAGETYRYRVSSFNASGESPLSDPTGEVEWLDELTVEIEPWEEDGIEIDFHDGEVENDIPDSVEPGEEQTIAVDVTGTEGDPEVNEYALVILDGEGNEVREVEAEEGGEIALPVEIDTDDQPFSKEDIDTYTISFSIELDVEGDTKPYEKQREITVIPEFED